MSAPSDRAASAASPATRCACTNISLIQLFHELKQKFPAAPDHAVSAAISAYCHDKRACEQHLERHAASSLAHAYHASSSAAARKLRDLSANLTPIECQNKLIDRRQYPATSTVKTLVTEKPQNAKLSNNVKLDDNSNIETVDSTRYPSDDCADEQDINKNIADKIHTFDNSPITINIDNCIEKSTESPSDVETESDEKSHQTTSSSETAASSSYRILKSNKIPSNLNKKLDKSIEDIDDSSSSNKETEKELQPDIGKPKRPCTLEFIKPQTEPHITQQTTHEEPPKASSTERQQTDIPEAFPLRQWSEQGYPLLSVNVNCHMDFANRPGAHYPERWIDDYDSPRAFTSVNLTVCTPTSATMQSPTREVRTGDREFEGHVTVTVSPSATRAPRRVAPPPPSQQRFQSAPTIDRSAAVQDNTLIARQLARKRRLVEELAREKENLARVAHETAVLAAPLPSPAAATLLRQQVEWLREQCQRLSRQLDSAQSTDRTDYYRSYPQERRSPLPTRPAPPPPEDAPSWQCQICTFSNHGLLNKCEQCEMPRILLVGPGDEITVRVIPGSGRRKIVRSWVL